MERRILNFPGHFSVNTWFLQPYKRNCYLLLLKVTPSIDTCNVTFVVNSTNPLAIRRLKAMLVPYDYSNSADFFVKCWLEGSLGIFWRLINSSKY